MSTITNTRKRAMEQAQAGRGSTESSSGAQAVTTQRQERPRFQPAFDLQRGPSGFTLIADMPGCSPDAVEIRLEQGVLHVFGRVTPREPVAPRNGYLLEEYEVGDYELSLRLPEIVDPDAVSARVSDGVLTVTMPLRPAAQPRRITVSS
jgi:HSP20 family protein